MSGHNKWSQIQRQKGATDAKKSKEFSKHSRILNMESKKAGGNVSSPSLAAAIENAKRSNVPKDVIERAIKKGNEAGSEILEQIHYESYGPGGCAIIIEMLTGNRNKSAQDVKHILSKNGFTLAAPGSASWAFKKDLPTGQAGNMKWVPQNTLSLSDEDLVMLEKLVDELENNDDVQEVFTNVE